MYCSIAAFGQHGPLRDLPAHDLSTEAFAGVVSLNLGNDGQPTMPHVPAADMAASMLAFGGIMMALFRREKTGLGDYIDIAMHDSILAWTPNVLGEVFANKRPPVVKHERTFGGAARSTRSIRRRTAGTSCSVRRNTSSSATCSVRSTSRNISSLCERGPGPHQKPVIEFLRGVFSQKTQAEWIEWFKGRDIPFAPVLNLREAFDHPHAAARDMHLVDPEGHEQYRHPDQVHSASPVA